MGDPSVEAQVKAAEAYEQFFVPALFQEWAPRVADAAGVRPGQRVLDVACGTGVLAREVAARLGDSGGVAGLDPNAGMLTVAARRAPGVEWRQGAAESIPYADGSFDAVVSQFGLMFFADRRRALGEMLRVLVPGGRLAVAVWDRLENTPAYAAEVALLERVAGRAAADALRAPFVLGDPDALSALFRDAGAVSVGVETLRGTARFPNVRSMVEGDLGAGCRSWGSSCRRTRSGSFSKRPSRSSGGTSGRTGASRSIPRRSSSPPGRRKSPGFVTRGRPPDPPGACTTPSSSAAARRA
ncbi:MAG TPA: class I SAM-dependent methyltransferase [Planctomycetota bacterium]|nr:class I SAM-dependent methyltransferase [Planctomycetota bacterium]